MNLSEAFLTQADACKKLDSPFMHRLLTMCGNYLHDSNDVVLFMLGFDGDIGPSGHSLPLRFAGGLHALKQQGYEPLVDAFPPNIEIDQVVWDAVETAMLERRDFLIEWLKNPPQTNEVRRSAALIPAAALASKLTDLPLSLIELGASAGLNLNFDKYRVQTPSGLIGNSDPVLTLTPEWHGDSPDICDFVVSHRCGCDLAPIDPKSDDGRMRLLSYLWPDQPHRIDLTNAAISVANTPVAKSDALAFLKDRLVPTPGSARFLFHTVAWQYFPPETQSEGAALIQTAGQKATADSPLAWFSMEAGKGLNGAELRLRLWPGEIDLHLGHADFHGRWINWKSPNLADTLTRTEK